MKQHDPTSCVCHEPEPVARAWQKIRDELSINVLHHDRQRVFDIVAHELAEQIREDTRASLTRVTASNGADWGRTWAQGRERAADLIDPEVKR